MSGGSACVCGSTEASIMAGNSWHLQGALGRTEQGWGRVQGCVCKIRERRDGVRRALRGLHKRSDRCLGWTRGLAISELVLHSAYNVI